MAHTHETAVERRQKRSLASVFFIVSAFVPVQFIGAHSSESTVLFADALHLVLDILALAASLYAMHLSLKPASERFPFGFRRAEPIAAMFNGILVLLATALIVREAVEQLREGHSPLSRRMLYFSIAGVVINGIAAWLLHDSIHAGHSHGHDGHHHSHHHDHSHGRDDHGGAAPKGAPRHPHDDHDEGAGHALNLRSARLHLVGDTLGALAALLAALVIHFGGPAAVDPIASFFVAGILLIGATRLLRDATIILLEAAPARLPHGRFVTEVAEFSTAIRLKEVRSWSIGAGHDAACLVVEATEPVGAALASHLKQHLGLAFVTVQVDAPDSAPHAG